LPLAVVDVPFSDLDPLHERATVRMEMPVSLVVQNDIPGVQVGLAMWARLGMM
jgi:hypothetical protein